VFDSIVAHGFWSTCLTFPYPFARGLIEKAPEELGYEFGRWTGERLGTYLVLKTGIELSGSQIRKILKRKKYVYLWAKYSLEDKQKPEKRAEFYQKLTEYLAIAKSKPELL
jgi:hypothetical protein